MSLPVATASGPVRRAALDAILGLLDDAEVTDVLVNGPGEVWRERAGRLERTGVWVRRSDIDVVIEQLLIASGRRVDRGSPIVDARLDGGSRLNVVLPPVAVDGPCVTIRRFTRRGRTLEDFATPQQAALLVEAVVRRMNIVVSGATGAGKTSMLNALATHIDGRERIVTIEDAAELDLPGEHVVRLETRPPSAEGRGSVTIADLVRTALRLRPDRIIVGECRGAEAHDLIQALHTGHLGSLTTVHANGPVDALERLALLAATAPRAPGAEVLHRQLVAAVGLVVHLGRPDGGRRRVAAVLEVGVDPPTMRSVAGGAEEPT